MPAESQWESYFDATALLSRFNCDRNVNSLVEFGCGYGTFTVAAAKSIAGSVVTFDIDPEMVARTQQRCRSLQIENVKATVRDFCAEGTGLPSGRFDFVMLFNILHIEDPVSLLCEAKRLLSDTGCIAVIHWRSDIETPRGPSMSIRPKPEDCQKWADSLEMLMTVVATPESCPWHWAAKLNPCSLKS